MATDTVTTNADSGTGSLRAVLAAAAAGATIVFDPTVFTNATTDDIKLASSLTITQNVTIEGHVGGGTGPADIAIDGQNAVTDLVINSGVSADLDGLLIENGNGAGVNGTAQYNSTTPGTGNTRTSATAAAGGIFDSGTLTLGNSVVTGNTATGGNGAHGLAGRNSNDLNVISYGVPGGGGAAAAGGIYVASGATLDLVTGSDAFSANKATGGNGGHGGRASAEGYIGGAGGVGGYSTSSGIGDRAATAGGAGQSGDLGNYGGAGGQPGRPGQPGGPGSFYDFPYEAYQTKLYEASTGGGGGGDAFADYGGAGTIAMVAAPCYCPGTLIEITRGEMPVELLAIGDTVVTAFGECRPIKWLGRRSYAGRFLAANPGVQPIRFRAGSLGDGLPRRGLLVSPDHAMLLDGLLIPARALVNGSTIVQDRIDRVDYHHVELDSHDVLLAEGAASESFLDDDSRGLFHNARAFAALYPDAPAPAGFCAPRVESGYQLEAIRTRLAATAGELARAA